MRPKIKLLVVITTFLIAMSVSNAFGASVVTVTQHEAGVQNDQGVTIEKANNNETTLEPRQIRIKTDSVPEDKAEKNEEKMEKYKIPTEGEGERK